MQAVTYRMDKQQGPTVEHRELYSTFSDKLYEKEQEKVICIITESLWCTTEINTTL